jgi:exonuclease III
VFNFVSWNVRGLNDCAKCPSIREVLTSSNAHLVALQETKLARCASLKAKSFLPYHLDAFACVDADGSRGGILTTWHPQLFTLECVRRERFSLTVILSSALSDLRLSITNVYGPADHTDSPAFLDDLRALAMEISGA